MKQPYLLITLLLLWCAFDGAAQDNGAAIVSGNITNEAGEPLAARIVLTNMNGQVVNSFYEKLPGFFTMPDGSFFVHTAPGTYRYDIYRGIDYLSASGQLQVKEGDENRLNISLSRWYPLKEKGWVNGDGHDHLYTDRKYDSLMLDTVRRICLAQGIDFMCTAQGWAGYHDSNWRAGYARYSDGRFYLHYGSEMPKYRTGHTWWIGQTTTNGLFENTMDYAYENQYYQSPNGTSWTFDELKFPQVPDIEVVRHFRKYNDAVSVIAHPTSWWWQKRGDIEKYVTNVAAYLPFGLLSGKIWDAQVIMGYNRDHYYYQDLWFHVLNLGYRMTPVAELDGGYNRTDKFYYGSMRTYYHIDGDLTIDKVKAAIRNGHTFVTSGPLVFASIDSSYQVGDVVPANGKAHTLYIDARASGDREDFISYVVLFRNGRIYKLWDIRSSRLRQFKQQLTLKETDNSWYVLKVYGKRAWGDPALLDVIRYNQMQKKPYDSIGSNSDVAISSPFYFRKNANLDPAPLVSEVELHFSENGAPYAGTLELEILDVGQVVHRYHVTNGKLRIQLPLQAVLKISRKGRSTLYRTLYLDYEPYRDILENIASGKWMDVHSQKFAPGEIPWSAFQFNKTQRMLKNIRWNIELSPNERDPLWAGFHDSFSSKP